MDDQRGVSDADLLDREIKECVDSDGASLKVSTLNSRDILDGLVALEMGYHEEDSWNHYPCLYLLSTPDAGGGAASRVTAWELPVPDEVWARYGNSVGFLEMMVSTASHPTAQAATRIMVQELGRERFLGVSLVDEGYVADLPQGHENRELRVVTALDLDCRHYSVIRRRQSGRRSAMVQTPAEIFRTLVAAKSPMAQLIVDNPSWLPPLPRALWGLIGILSAHAEEREPRL